MAEPEILAHHDIMRLQAVDQRPLNKILCTLLSQITVKSQGEQMLHTEPLQQPRLLPEGGEAERFEIGRKEGTRMRLEGHDQQWQIIVQGKPGSRFDQATVTQMNPVEIADHDNTAKGVGGKVANAAIEFHRVSRYSSGSEKTAQLYADHPRDTSIEPELAKIIIGCRTGCGSASRPC